MTEARPSTSTSVVPSVPTTVPSTTIRFFISSTFADFQVERDVLQKQVFPKLRQLCAASGFRLQPIDLRWGVSEAAGTDRQTLRICFDELERCRQLSPDFFLLILLGERYGSYILPPQVPAALIERLVPQLSPEERAHFDAAYRLDENAVPPEYVLLRAEGQEQTEDEVLRLALVQAGQAAGVGEADRLPFEGSATHREIQLGLLGEPPGSDLERGVLCAARMFTGSQMGPETDRFAAQDAKQVNRVQELTSTILARLPHDQVQHYAVPWEGESGPAFDEKALAETYLGLLRPKLEAVITERTAAREAAKDQGQDETTRANSAFALERAVRVEGREAERARLEAYLVGAWGDGLPLVVTGPAGSGKSTLLADAATQAAATQSDAALVTRYIGVTPGTGSLFELLTSLRRAIAQAYDQPEPAQMDGNQLVSAVAAELATLTVSQERPLLVVLDALDQLGPHTQRTDWLPTKLAPNVRVVVSVLADRAELRYLRAGVPAEQVMTLAPLGEEAGRALLHQLLAAAPARTLTLPQEEAVLAAFAPEGLPLYLRLVATEARRWRSFDLPELGDGPLAETIPVLLDTLLTRLQAPGRYGQELVAHALGDLAAARYGLAEDELLAVLAQDHAVRSELQRLAKESPKINSQLPLPVALWARLYAEVAPLLTERERDGVRLFTFFHQQLRTAVETRYLRGTERIWRHRVLAAYFSSQAWRLGLGKWNWRKVDEQVTQEEWAGQRAAAAQTLEGLADQLENETDDVVAIIDVVTRLEDHVSRGGHWRVGERFYRQQLAVYQTQGNWAGESIALGVLGALAAGQGRLDEATRYYEQALTIAQEVGHRAAEGAILSNLGGMADLQGRLDEAAHFLEQALAIYRELGDRPAEADVLNRLGVLADHQGRLAGAVRYLEQALAIAQEVGDRAQEGITLSNLGALVGRQGHSAQAVRYLEQAFAIQRELGHRAVEAATLDNLGQLARLQGRSDEATRYYEQALAIAQEVGDRAQEGMTLGNLGTVAAGQGRLDEATRYYEQALAIVQEVGHRAQEGTTLCNLGVMADRQGRSAEAAHYLEQALAIYRELGDRSGEGITLQHLGGMERGQGRLDEAAHYLEQALAIYRELGDRAQESSTLHDLGVLAAEQGRSAEAADYYKQALGIFEAIGDHDYAEVTREALRRLTAQRSRRRWWPFGRRRS